MKVNFLGATMLVVLKLEIINQFGQRMPFKDSNGNVK